jgi:uncharacterized membrane protein
MEHRSTIDRVRDLRKQVRNTNESSLGNLSPLERWAVGVTQHVGSVGFFLIVVVWTVLWILWNLFAPHELRFDPYPAFVFWLFISNLIQLILTPLLLVGQNLLNKRAEARADEDFKINKIAEQEIELILTYLEKHSEQLDELSSFHKKK